MERPQRVVLTGATNGLGRLAAIELAKMGAELILIARNQSKAMETEATILSLEPKANIRFYHGDLSRIDDIVRLGKAISHDYPEIDVLINNAGVHNFSQRISSDGLSEMTTVNYFAPWILTGLLENCLERSGRGRVVNVASEASRNSGKLCLPEDLGNIEPYSTRESSTLYGRSKLLILMFSLTLATRLMDRNVSVVGLCPGFNVTGLGRDLGFASVLSILLNFLGIGNPKKGSDLIVRLATIEPRMSISGKYFSVKSKDPISPIAVATDLKLQQSLWTETEKLMKEKGCDVYQ
jgi:short-subunit dehydrogenase